MEHPWIMFLKRVCGQAEELEYQSLELLAAEMTTSRR
jgi:hypothetical protein